LQYGKICRVDNKKSVILVYFDCATNMA
jgi:hypothetical protein